MSSGISYFSTTRKSDSNTETPASPSTITSQGSPPPSGGFPRTGPISPPHNIARLSSGSGGNADDEATHLSRSPVVQPPWPEADIANAISHLSTDETIEYERSYKSPCPVHEPESNLPKLSIDDVLQWRSRRKPTSKWKKENEKLEHHEYLNRVKDRDHIFLVDDALSMKSYWSDVVRLFKALSYLTKTVDKDGFIQLHFTVSPNTYKDSKSTPLVLEVEEREEQLSVTSNPETACDKILRAWKQEMNPGKLRALVRRPSMSPITLYILTDGVWEDRSNLDGFVKDVVRFVDENSLSRKHIGIQFIQFGQDPRGTARLAHLDSGLNLAIDIVDTEPSTGNVLKILLGPVDETFDAEIPAGAKCTCARR